MATENKLKTGGGPAINGFAARARRPPRCCASTA